ncbi:MAG: FHA domain-containing protein [Bacteroidaceae bacterium]|nr:FHA domain-containing protein [Bacteroidaceae bacterium]
MKRIRCPRCEHYITFDETNYKEGQSLMFECEECKKKFSIRIGAVKLVATQREANASTEVEDNGFGSITVVENVFGFRQSYALQLGDNVIGRRNKGDEITIPIETTDRSMDRRHCVITVKKEQDNSLSYSLRDYPSLTGTFLFNRILGDRERALIEDGAIITLGATTIIFQAHAAEE